MREQLERLLGDSEVTRLAVAMIDAGEQTAIYTLEKAGADAMRPDTVWPVASLTKPLFVYGALLLVQQGQLELEHPMRAYLPQPYADDPFVPQMTVRQAMSHTTGFPNWRSAEGLRAAFAPSTKFSYSSEGLTYLQQVVESVTQMPLSQYLQERVFAPLGMQHTQLQAETPGDLPPTMEFLKGSLLANAALSLRTTIEDYARFMNAMLEWEWLDEMLHPQIAVVDVPNLQWGLGWGLQKGSTTHSFWHWGARGIPRTMNFAMGIPEQGKAIVIFTDHANGLYLCQNIIEAWIGETKLPAFDWLLPAQSWRPDGKKRD